MDLNRNVQEKSWFCKGHLQKGIGRTEFPAMYTPSASTQLDSSFSLQYNCPGRQVQLDKSSKKMTIILLLSQNPEAYKLQHSF